MRSVGRFCCLLKATNRQHPQRLALFHTQPMAPPAPTAQAQSSPSPGIDRRVSVSPTRGGHRARRRGRWLAAAQARPLLAFATQGCAHAPRGRTSGASCAGLAGRQLGRATRPLLEAQAQRAPVPALRLCPAPRDGLDRRAQRPRPKRVCGRDTRPAAPQAPNGRAVSAAPGSPVPAQTAVPA